MNDCCIIAAIGESSLHREWINKGAEFDLHLIVYDDSYETFRLDTPFVTQSKGYKFKLVDDYLVENNLIDKYKYFYLPDDDILIDSENIHRLFWYMDKYRFSIAQPSIYNFYITYPHTLRRPNSKLRSTNFVEMMQPCFSRDALEKVRFTFSASRSGWGIDFHWAKILDYHNTNMAIIDDVISVHTRPVQSNHREDLAEYLKKYDLGSLKMG